MAVILHFPRLPCKTIDKFYGILNFYVKIALMMINKIYIIGGARSGKSFFGKQLSNKTGIRHFDLDKIIFTYNWEKVSEQYRDRELGKILLGYNWIIEGVYTENWIVTALKKSDKIIWLDTPALIKLFRFLKQTISGRKGGFKNFYGRGKLAVGLKHKEFDRSRSCYKNLLQPFKDKVSVIKTKNDLRFFLKNMEKLINCSYPEEL